jgi:Ser/Thr protein kinase RdoA (MazF antagonist)
MDAGLKVLVCRSIAEYCSVSPDSIVNLAVEKVYDADRQIFRLTPERRTERFALKLRGPRVSKQTDANDGATADEFARVQTAYAAVRQAGGTIQMPVPVGLFPEYRAILTTWCDGRGLRRSYYANAWRWPLSSDELRSQFRLSGAWLGEFHNASRYTADSTDVFATRLRHVERMIGEISASPRNALTIACLGRVYAAIRERLLASEEVELGLLHGNFTLRNILVSPHAAAPVDFEDSREDAISMDTGQLIADIILSAYRPLTRESARREVAAEFVRAYGEHVPLDYDRVAAYAIYHILAAYYEVTSRVDRNRVSSMVAARQTRVFADMLSDPDSAVAACLQESSVVSRK